MRWLLAILLTLAPASAWADAFSSTPAPPPALPLDPIPFTGQWVTATDGGGTKYLTTVSPSPTCSIMFPANYADPTTVTSTFLFTAGSPAGSESSITYCICLLPTGACYQVQIHHDTVGSSAILVQKAATNRSGYTPLGSGVGTASTTFTNGIKYTLIFNATGTTTVALTVSVQRASDGNYLTSAGTWSASKQNAITTSDSSSPLATNGTTEIDITNIGGVADGVIYDYSLRNAIPRFTQYNGGVAPVITKGGTFDGFTNNALDGPCCCFDGSRFVAGVQMNPTVGAAWAWGFYHSTDMVNWTAMAGSLMHPPSGQNLVGNSGMRYWNGAIWMAQWYGPNAGGPGASIDILKSTDPTLQVANWTTVVSALLSPSNTSDNFSPKLVINPMSGKIELWFAQGGLGRSVYMMDSVDGITWGSINLQFTTPWCAGNDWGQVAVWYIGNRRYMTSDSSPASFGSGHYHTQMFHQDSYTPNAWTFDGYVNGPVAANTWESVNLGATDVLVADTGDGNGAIPRMLSQNSDNTATTTGTDSSIGFGSLIQPQIGPASGGGRRL